MSEHGTELHSRQVAEDAREREWKGKGFLRELFLGNFRFDWIAPFPDTELGPEAKEFLERLASFLEIEVDSIEIDRTGEYPEHVLSRLRELGAFGMKIPKEYGGLGFNTVEYARAIELCAQYDASIVALLSAHQSIGVPQPLERFGTEAQKRKYLPRCAAGAISAFALTEPNVGSDPASLATVARKTPEGDYVITGEKLWCTNGTLAELFVVMARDPETKRISAFVVEANSPGVRVVHRCRFMGIRAIANAVVRFEEVRVPAANLIGKEGDGLKIALVTLNTGRLSLPAACVGFTKNCARIVREWSNERVQWGLPIGKHEAVAHQVADITATTYAIESMTRLATELALRDGYDIRLEAAAAKEWATVQGWRVVDRTMQIRGGRGYETEASLRDRGEAPIGVERMMRDCRINLIFEGSSEIMHLFMAREAVDKHLDVAGKLVDPKASLGDKLRALPAIIAFYAIWYPTRWLKRIFTPFFSEHGRLARHLRFCHRASAALATNLFHGMLVYQAKLERRQAFLFRAVDIANDLFAMSASISRAARLSRDGAPHAESAVALAETFALAARRRVQRNFDELFDNDDARNTAFAARVLGGSESWLEAVPGVPGEAPPTVRSGFPGAAEAPEPERRTA